MRIKGPKDFWAGLMFVGIGLFFLFVARSYNMGDATHMGPAYFPTVLGSLMAVLGGIVFFRSLAVKGGKIPAMSFRPLFFTTVSLLGFGYLLKPTGIVLAMAVLIAASGLAGYDSKLKELILLCIVLVILSVLVFVKGLGLPFPVWPEFLS